MSNSTSVGCGCGACILNNNIEFSKIRDKYNTGLVVCTCVSRHDNKLVHVFIQNDRDNKDVICEVLSIKGVVFSDFYKMTSKLDEDYRDDNHNSGIIVSCNF